MTQKTYESRAAYDYAESKKISLGSLTEAAAIVFAISFTALTFGAVLAGDGNDTCDCTSDDTIQIQAE
jgi:hypothetical protein